MRWFLVALLGLGIVLPTATHSFAQAAPGNSGASSSDQTGEVGNQGNGKNAETSGNAGGTHKSK